MSPRLQVLFLFTCLFTSALAAPTIPPITLTNLTCTNSSIAASTNTTPINATVCLSIFQNFTALHTTRSGQVTFTTNSSLYNSPDPIIQQQYAAYVTQLISGPGNGLPCRMFFTPLHNIEATPTGAYTLNGPDSSTGLRELGVAVGGVVGGCSEGYGGNIQYTAASGDEFGVIISGMVGD